MNIALSAVSENKRRSGLMNIEYSYNLETARNRRLKEYSTRILADKK